MTHESGAPPPAHTSASPATPATDVRVRDGGARARMSGVSRARNLLALAFVSVAVIPALFIGIWANSVVVRLEHQAKLERHHAHERSAVALLDQYVSRVERWFRNLNAYTQNHDTRLRDLPFAPNASAVLRWFAVYDADGATVDALALDNREPDADETLIACLRAIASTTVGPKITDVVLDGGGRPGVYIVAAQNDRLSVARLDLAPLRRMFAQITFGNGGYAVLLDAAGRVIAHPKPDWEASALDMSGYVPVQTAISSDSGMLRYYSSRRNQPVTAGHLRVERTGWIVLTPEPAPAGAIMSKEVQGVALVVTLAGFFVAALLAWALSGVLLGPVEAIARAARVIAGGGAPDDVGRVRANSREVVELDHSFNALMRRVRSDRAAAEQAADEQRRALLASVAANFPGVVFRRVRAADGTVSYPIFNVGDAPSLMFNASGVDFTLERVLFPEDGERLRAAFDASERRLTPIAEEVRIVDAQSGGEGRPRWARCASAPQRAADGAIVWDGVLLDVTELIEAEEAMRDAMESAEALSQAKSEFLANMSHELRTPLNVILGFADMMRSGIAGPIGARPKDYSELIHASASHLLELINRLLDLSRMEAGRLELKDEEVPLNDELRSVAALFDEQARTRDVTLATMFDQAPEILFDRLALRQIMINLVSNAVKFAPAGGRVELSTRFESDEIEISVRDNGRGMSEEELQRVFERFYSHNSKVSDNLRGIGLGLQIAKSLADLHSADLTLESTLGEGATARLVIPNARVLNRNAAA